MTNPNSPSLPPSYDELRLFAEMFNDVQEFRKAIANKVRSGGVDSEVIGAALEHYAQAEHAMKLELRRCYKRTVPASIQAWAKREKGIGVTDAHLLARLLGVIGDPRLANPYHWEGSGRDNRVLVADEPFERTLHQLWSYCGHGDPKRKRRAKMDRDDAMALGNPQAKMLVWNLATACMKTDGHFREVYDKRRAATAERLHAEACVRCGPSGKPAQAGSPWSKAHQHADALRIVGKEILRDLWVAAKIEHPSSEVPQSTRSPIGARTFERAQSPDGIQR